MTQEPIQCDLAVIGAGMAGMAATLFAVNRGLITVQIGSSAEIGFASGLFDLLGTHPIAERRIWGDPWAATEALVRDIPKHPYARLEPAEIKAAFEELLSFLKKEGLPYAGYKDRNVKVITPLGTVKTTYAVPQSMWNGVKALEAKSRCVLAGIRGLKGFSTGLISDRLQWIWPQLRPVQIAFPETDPGHEVYPEHLANALVIIRNRAKLVRALKPHIHDAEALGLPAILGLYNPNQVISYLESELGLPIFEIFTMPPAISGMRLKAAFERGLRAGRLHYFAQKRVLEVRKEANQEFEVITGRTTAEQTVISRGVILATGRFIGGGLAADRRQIRETLLGLPVFQPKDRSQWHREDLFDARGHAVNLAGLETDEYFRPMERNGKAAFETLYAAGSILAHQDWKRMKCGVGLAVATAYKAVNSFVEQLG